MKIIYNAKDRGTFRSARWLKDYIPDLSIASRNSLNDNTMVTRYILGNFPHSQYRLILLNYRLQIPSIRSFPKPRWNFRKANWVDYGNELDHIISWILPKASSYDRFVGAIQSVARKYIPRGFRKFYINDWDKDCTKLFEDFQKNNNSTIADDLIGRLNAMRKQTR